MGVDVTASYHAELCRAMNWLGEQDKVIFLGQGVGNPGTSMSDTLVDVPAKKRIEFPVAEELQTGVAIGMSLQGFVPVSIIPRWNFMLRASDQLINHMDRLPLYSAGGYKPKVIVRVATPSVSPFNPGPQHDADFTKAFREMLRTTSVLALAEAYDIVPAYQEAFKADCSTILVEYTDKYRDVRGSK